MQSRVVHYDVLCGVMLLFMMHHHACGMCGLSDAPIHLIPYKVLYFYIAYFFFKAGCFYHPDKNLKQVFLDSCKRLLVPYVLFSALGYVIFGATDPITTLHYWWSPMRQVLTIGRVEGNGPLWFLLSLFIVRVLYQTSGNTQWKQISWIIIGAIIGIVGNYYGVRPRTISNVGLGIFFYGFGYLMRDFQYNKRIGNIFLVSFVLLYIAMFIWGWQLVDFSFNITEFGFHPIWLASCAVACIALNYLLRNYSWQYSPLAWIGKHSMPFLCIHAMIYELLHLYVYPSFTISPYLMLSIDWVSFMAICSVMVFVFRNKYLSWMIGE